MKKTSEGIVRVGRNNGVPVVSVGPLEVTFKPSDDQECFFVDTAKFSPLVSKGSVATVWMGTDKWEPTTVVLAAGNRQLEILPYSKAKGLQVLGCIMEVHSWPGHKVVNYCD